MIERISRWAIRSIRNIEFTKRAGSGRDPDQRARESAYAMIVCCAALVLVYCLAAWLVPTLIALAIIIVGGCSLFVWALVRMFFSWVDGESNTPAGNAVSQSQPHPQARDPLGWIFAPPIKELVVEFRIWWSGVREWADSYLGHPDLYGDSPNFWLDWCKLEAAPWPFGRRAKTVVED